MILLLNINVIFDIKEEDIDISNSSHNELDNILNRILNIIDSIRLYNTNWTYNY